MKITCRAPAIRGRRESTFLTADMSCPRCRSDRMRTVPVVDSEAMRDDISANKKAVAPQHHRFFKKPDASPAVIRRREPEG